MSRFIAVDRSTEYLLPPSVQDWLPQNQLARFVVDVVERNHLLHAAMFWNEPVANIFGASSGR